MANSWISGKPLPNKDQLAELQKDPRCVQWHSRCKAHFVETGKHSHPPMNTRLMKATRFRGWYRFTNAGWAAFTGRA